MARRYRTSERIIPDPRWNSLPPGPPPFRVLPTRTQSLKQHRRRRPEVESNKPHTIDVIGCGPETTICGHIDLLYLLPLHNTMHRKLLKTFKNKPGNYEGKYRDRTDSKASVVDYGKGYLALHLLDDITRPEMSEFLLSRNWRMMNANCTVQDGQEVIYEKWTNVLSNKSAEIIGRPRPIPMAPNGPRRYF